MQEFAWTALATLLALIVYFMTSVGVARARVKYNVPAPATTGDPQFERRFRVQMNTLEWLPIFLPALWIAAGYWDSRIIAAIGVVWIIGRFMYMEGYIAEAGKRSMGFMVQGIATLILLIASIAGAVMALIG